MRAGYVFTEGVATALGARAFVEVMAADARITFEALRAATLVATDYVTTDGARTTCILVFAFINVYALQLKK